MYNVCAKRMDILKSRCISDKQEMPGQNFILAYLCF